MKTNTTDKVDILLEKFQEVYNLFTDLQEEIKNKETETLIEYDQLVEIVEEVINSVDGEEIQINDYELSMNYDNKVEIDNAYIDSTESFCSTSIVSALSRFIKKKEYLVGYTIKTSGEGDSKENSEFIRIKATNSESAVRQIRNFLQNDMYEFNNGNKDYEYKYLDTSVATLFKHTKAEVVKVEIIENTLDREVGLDAVSVE